MATEPGDITALLRRARDPRDSEARELLFPLVAAKLRQLAAARLRQLRPGHSLRVTELIDQAFARLVPGRRAEWECRGQFFALASGVMRRLLADYVRGDLRRPHPVPLDPHAHGHLTNGQADDPAAQCQRRHLQQSLLEALDRLEREDADTAAVFELRVFGGRCLDLGSVDGGLILDPLGDLLSFREVADLLGMPRSTVFHLWTKAVRRLQHELRTFAPAAFEEVSHVR